MVADRRRQVHEDLRRSSPARALAAAGTALAVLAVVCGSTGDAAAGAGAVAAAGSSAGVSALPAMAPNLTGPMARLRGLIGSWTCTSTPASGGMATSFTVMAAPGNTLETWLRSPLGSAAGFVGYRPRDKVYWSVSADNTGARYFQTSPDGVRFTGTMVSFGDMDPLRVTMTEISASKFHTVSEVREESRWVKTGDNICTRS